jgi:hypothetical protein
MSGITTIISRIYSPNQGKTKPALQSAAIFFSRQIKIGKHSFGKSRRQINRSFTDDFSAAKGNIISTHQSRYRNQCNLPGASYHHANQD